MKEKFSFVSAPSLSIWFATFLAAIFLSKGAQANGDWVAFGGDQAGSQYSPLAQITAQNVDDLEVAWIHKSGDIVDLPGLAGTSYEVTPLHANETLYYCTPLDRVFALDPVTGKEKWVFDSNAVQPDTGEPLLDEAPAPVYCRGVAYWQSAVPDAGGACAKRIFKGDGRGHVFAMDADTGLPCRDFGAEQGHPGYVSHQDYENYGDGFIAITSPPAVFNDLVIVGSVVDDTLPHAKNGIVRAFDARTGRLVWEFDPVPEDISHVVGGGNVWSTMSVDEERGLVFLPTTSLSTDYYGAFREGGSGYADAVVALDARDGSVRWHYQLIHHDLFDYDLPGHALLVTIQKDGQAIDVAIQQTKLGEIFVFERDTGRPIYPIEERPVPRSEVAGEVSSPTQPHSTGIDSFSVKTLSADNLFGLALADRWWCEAEFSRKRYDGVFTPPSADGSIIFPSIRGGGNWGGAAYDPDTNLLIVRADNLASLVSLFEPAEEDDVTPSIDYDNRTLPVEGTPYWVNIKPFLSPLGVPCTPPPWGELTAIDMGTGKTKWRVPLGQSKKWGVTLPESWGWGSPLNGGPIVTAGGLVFIAAGLDHHIRAFDVRTGDLVWKHDLPAPGMAVPMTYEAAGEQYVVIAAGGNSQAKTKLSDAIVALRLTKD